MADVLEKIGLFISAHHVMTLATSYDNIPQSCNLFYTYLPEKQLFVVASDPKTEHMQNVLINPNIAGSIVLETKAIGKIEGLQFKGLMSEADKSLGKYYFEAFPYARVMAPTLWVITLETMKLTDNRLGFGKKLNWSRDVASE